MLSRFLAFVNPEKMLLKPPKPIAKDSILVPFKSVDASRKSQIKLQKDSSRTEFGTKPRISSRDALWPMMVVDVLWWRPSEMEQLGQCKADRQGLTFPLNLKEQKNGGIGVYLGKWGDRKVEPASVGRRVLGIFERRSPRSPLEPVWTSTGK